MNYDLEAPSYVVLTLVKDRAVLTNTIYNMREVTPKGGRVGQSVDVYIDILADVEVKAYTAADKAADSDYEFDAIDFAPISVKLSDELYAAVYVDGWDNLVFGKENVTDFSSEINTLATKILTRLENAVGAAINGVSTANTTTVTVPAGISNQELGELIIEKIADLKFEFDNNDVPDGDRYIAVGRNAYNALLSTEAVRNASQTGEAGESAALRAATVGVIAGFTVVNSGKIDDNALVAYYFQAFGVISRAPGKNVSAPYSELFQGSGIEGTPAPIDLRVNVLGLGKRNATGVVVSTFFTAQELTEDATKANRLVEKVVFTPAASK